MGMLLLPVLLIPSTVAMDAILLETKQLKVGQIFIVGNENTPDHIIRELLHLYPGQVLEMRNVQEAEDRLTRSGHFVVDVTEGHSPRITILWDSPSPFRDLLMEVKDRPPAPPKLPRLLLGV